MKTLNIKIRSSILLILFFALLTFSTDIIAQDDEKQKTVKVKMIKSVDGKETTIDTTFNISSDAVELKNIEDIEALLNIEGLEDLDLRIKSITDEIENMDVKVMALDSTADGMKYMIMVKDSEIMDEKQGEKIKEIEILLETGDTISEIIESEISVIVGDEGEVYMISGDDEEILEYSTKDGEHKFIIKKECNGEEEFDEEIIVIKGDDFKWTGEDAKKMTVEVEEDDGKILVIKKSGGKIDKYEIDSDEEFNKDVVLEIIKEGEDHKKVIIKSEIIIATLDEEDKVVLDKSGIDIGPGTQENNLELKNIDFHPNPTDGLFTLEFKTEKKGKVDISIYDINGKEVYSEKVKDFDGHYNKKIDISNEQGGTYFLRISQDLNSTIRKIIVK